MLTVLSADVPSRAFANAQESCGGYKFVASFITSATSPGWNISGQRTISIGMAILWLEISSQRHFFEGADSKSRSPHVI